MRLRVRVTDEFSLVIKRERPKVGQTVEVVVVKVGEEHSIERAHLVFQHLVAQIGAGIDQDPPFVFKQNCSPMPLVFFVCRSTDLTLATDYRYASRGAAA